MPEPAIAGETELLANIQRLFKAMGLKQATCEKCPAVIWFVPTKTGKLAPYTARALNHFIDCPAAADFRRK